MTTGSIRSTWVHWSKRKSVGQDKDKYRQKDKDKDKYRHLGALVKEKVCWTTLLVGRVATIGKEVALLSLFKATDAIGAGLFVSLKDKMIEVCL